MTVMQTLTVDNFVKKIKDMPPRDRNKLELNGLIDLIVQLPEAPIQNDITTKLTEMQQAIANIQRIALDNSQEIIHLKEDNLRLSRVNGELSKESTRIVNENMELKIQIDGIEQYLRVNNLEISGIEPLRDPQTNQLEPEEQLILECLNGLQPTTPVTTKDIDISHELPKRGGGKTHVIRFVSRKTKDMILTAKKNNANRNYKFRERSIYINEHLTTFNKNLFRLAKIKKNALDFKYLWTRGGKIFLRHHDNSEVIQIISEEQIASLI